MSTRWQIAAVTFGVLLLLTAGCGKKEESSQQGAKEDTAPPPEPPQKVEAEASGGVRKEPGPGGLGTVHSTTVQDVVLAWEPVEGADSYTIYWSNTPGVTKQSGTRIANVTSPYIHGYLNEGKTYYYIVTSSRKGKESRASQEVSAKPEMGGLKFKIGDGIPVPMF
jgi:hypothetical protein